MKQVDYIKAAVTVPEAVRLYCPERKMRQGRIQCPIHNGNDYNMVISEKFYKCHVCGKGGDVISFVMELYGIDFRTALRRINEDFKLRLFPDKPRSRTQQLADERRRRELEARAKREKRIKEERAERDRIERKLWDAWIECDRALRELRPTCQGEPIDDRYIYALKNINYIEYLIDEL